MNRLMTVTKYLTVTWIPIGTCSLTGRRKLEHQVDTLGSSSW